MLTHFCHLASGIGLGVAEGLLAQKGWRVYLLDRNVKAFENLNPEIKAATNFRNIDVADYDSLATVFKDIYVHEGRIDFVFANAGIGGALDFYETKDEIAPPPKPNISAIDVNLNSVCYTTYLAAHYFKLQKLEDASVVITVSEAGLYPVIFAPVYTASKRTSVFSSLLILTFTQRKLQAILNIAKFRRFNRLFASGRPRIDRSQD